MYAIDEGLKTVNGVEVDTFQRDVEDGNVCLEVEAGTTGYKGGWGSTFYYSYGINKHVVHDHSCRSQNLASFSKHSELLLLADGGSPTIACNAQQFRTRHNSDFNALMMDGHVVSFKGKIQGDFNLNNLPSPYKYYFQANAKLPIWGGYSTDGVKQ